MMPFIEEHWREQGVEPICREWGIAPSTYYRHKAEERNPELQSRRKKEDAVLKELIWDIWDKNYRVYGVRKLWHEMKKTKNPVSRCRVERLMREMGIQGVVRGKVKWTTIAEKGIPHPLDLVNRVFQAERPNQLWVADFTYVRIRSGFAYTAFIIDVYSRRIVGWKVSAGMGEAMTLDALEQALWSRKIDAPLIHHSDRGKQYVSIRYSKRLMEARIRVSVGSAGDAYDNALAESINGLYKTELVKRRSWKSLQELEYATLCWVDWFNNTRLMEAIGYLSPAEFEKIYYTKADVPLQVSGLT